ncbi:MAG: hypothetical protein E5X09_08740 [Mesorhizobium sp.]|nr:MAG: hypothetical protein E5X09_08740 [Mesorhizobium sp.]
MRSTARLSAIAGALLAMPFPADAASLNTMNEVGAALQACWTPPAGTLIGPPKPTAIKVNGDDKARQAYVDAATAALRNCLPLSFSPDLAKGIPGKIFTLQFNSPKDNAKAIQQ